MLKAIVDYEFDSTTRGFAISAPNLIQEDDLDVFAFVLYSRSGPCLNFFDLTTKEIIWQIPGAEHFITLLKHGKEE